MMGTDGEIGAVSRGNTGNKRISTEESGRSQTLTDKDTHGNTGVKKTVDLPPNFIDGTM